MINVRETIDGLDVSLYTAGQPSNPPVVLLHGGGLMGATWSRVCDRLADRYFCVAPDLRGHGDTAWDPDGRYTLRQYGEDIRSLVRHLELRRPHLVGMSLGGLAALYAAIHGLEISSLSLVDVGPRLSFDGGRYIRSFLDVWTYPSFDAALDRAAQFNPRRSRESLASSLARSMRRNDDGSWSWKWDPRRRSSRGDRIREAGSLWPLLPAITAAVLVVRGEASPVFTADLAHEFVNALVAAGVPCQFVTIPDAGHSVQTDQPERLAEVLDTFFVNARDSHPRPNARRQA